MKLIRSVGESISRSFNSYFNMHVFVETVFTVCMILALGVIIIPGRCKLSTMVFLPVISLGFSFARLSKIWTNYWTPIDQKGETVIKKSKDGKESEWFIIYSEYSADNFFDYSFGTFLLMILKINFSILFSIISILLLILVVVF